MTGDRLLAEELAQDTFVKAWRSLAAFDTTRRLSSWIFRIAHNTAIDALRRTKPPAESLDAPPGTPGAPPEPAGPVEPDPLERAALARAIEDAMAHLRPEYRAAIALRYDQDLPFDEIAQIIGVPEATARSHVHRGRKELSRLLREEGWTPDRQPRSR